MEGIKARILNKVLNNNNFNQLSLYFNAFTQSFRKTITFSPNLCLV